jgi:hypothetical protein
VNYLVDVDILDGDKQFAGQCVGGEQDAEYAVQIVELAPRSFIALASSKRKCGGAAWM